jgi:hypothetical protein
MSKNSDVILTSMGGGIPGTGETITISITTGPAAESATLEAGISYEMSSDVDFHFIRTETGVDDATTADAVQRYTWPPVFFTATKDKLFVSAIAATTTGTVWIVPRTADVRKEDE